MLQNIQLVLRFGQLVWDVWQHKAAAADGQVNALYSVDDDISVAVYHYQVAVHAHYLAHDAQPFGVAELVHALKVEEQHAVAAELAHAHKLAAAKTFAQQHAEHRRLCRIFGRVDAEIHARRISPRGEQQFFASPVGAQHEHKLVAVGLVNLIDPCAERGLFYFFFDVP